MKEKGSLSLKKVIEYFSNTNIKSFPITLIVIINGECVATVSIFENDLKTPKKLTPWLASLYVSPDHRGQGIAKKLINKAQEIIKQLGFEVLYLRTEHTSGYYGKLGWKFVCKTYDEKEQYTEIFKYKIIK